MHLKYPRRKDFFSWEELGCFARALGFQKNLFVKNIPQDIEKDKLQGLDKKFITHLLDIKALHGDLHRTYNMHDALYNCNVIEKAMDMVLNKYLSFTELKEARVAFQLYEHEDMMGLVVDQHVILRTLKICGRVVSPKKLMQHIKHMKRHLPERLLLYEFLDLLLLCERESQVEVKPVTRPTGVDRHHLYKMANFESVLTPDDEKRRQQLNHLYELGLNKVPTGNKKQASWRDEEYWLVDTQPRIDLVSRGQQRSAHMGDHLDHSEKKVRHARCGYLGDTRGNPSFIDLNDAIRKRRTMLDPAARTPFGFSMFDEDEDEPQRVDTRVTFAPTPAEETKKQFSRPNTSSSTSGSLCHQFRGTKREQLSRASREGQLDILVSPRDLHNSHTRVENLLWDIETQGERLRQKYNKKMKEKYPRHVQLSHRTVETRVQPNERQRNFAFTRKESQLEFLHPETDTQQVSPRPRRRTVPKRDNIFKNLMTRLSRDNTLLDFGGIDVPVTHVTSSIKHGSLLSWQEEKPALQARNGRTRLHSMITEPRDSLRAKGNSEEKKDTNLESRDKELVELIDVFQEADFVASGKKVLQGADCWKENVPVK